MSFKIQSNFERNQSNHDLTNTSMNISNPLPNNNFKDEVIIESFRKWQKFIPHEKSMEAYTTEHNFLNTPMQTK